MHQNSKSKGVWLRVFFALILISLFPLTAAENEVSIRQMWQYQWPNSGESGTFQFPGKIPSRIKENRLIIWGDLSLKGYRNPALLLDIVLEDFSIYQDGILIHEFGESQIDRNQPPTLSGYIWPHLVSLNPKDGTSKIKFVIRSTYPRFIGVDRNVSLGERSQLLESLYLREPERILLAIVYLSLSMLCFLLPVQDPQNRIAIYYGALLLDIALFTGLNPLIVSHIASFPRLAVYVYYLSLFLMPVWLMLFLGRTLGPPTQRLFRAQAVLFSSFFGIFCFSQIASSWNILEAENIFQLISLPCLLFTVFLLLHGIWRKNSEAKILGAGMFLFGVFSVHDIFRDLEIIESDFVLFYYGLFPFLLSLGVIVIQRFSDVRTQLKLQSKDLEEKNIQLRYSNLLKDEFLTRTSESLKIPLEGIIGVSNTLQMKSQESGHSDYLSGLEWITQAARQLMYTINAVTDFTSMKYNQIEITPAPSHLHSIVSLVITIGRTQYESKSVDIRNHIEKHIMVHADSDRLEQILLSILNTRLRSMPEGFLQIEAMEYSEMVEIRIIDSGPAVRLDIQTFENRKFNSYRIEDTDGDYLNLSIAHRLIQLHDSELKLGRTQQDYNIFSFALPKLEESQLGEQPHRVASPHGFERISAKPIHRDYRKSQRIILIHEDSQESEMIYQLLANRGYSLKIFPTTELALQQIEQSLPDLVIVDLALSDGSARHFIQTIRTRYGKFDPLLLVLVQRGKISDWERTEAFGVNDYLNKPIDSAELFARVQTLMNLKLAVEDRNKLASLRRELDVATALHRSILPQESISDDSIQLQFLYKPFEDVGGDYFDFVLDPEGNLAVIMMDVSGHGIPACLVGAMCKIAFYMNRHLVSYPDRLLSAMNRAILGRSGKNFVTGIFAYIDLEDNKLVYSSAGHPAAIVQSSEGRIDSIKTTGKPLGILANPNFVSDSVNFLPGDRLIMYTDGILEVQNQKQDLFGEDRIKDFLKENANVPNQDILPLLETHIQEWSSGLIGQQDDITVLMVERRSF